MSLDKFASADGKLPDKPRATPAPQESSEDLFDFDELAGASAKVAAEMKKDLDQALSHVEAAAGDVAKAVASAPAKPAAPAPAPARVTAPPPMPPVEAPAAPASSHVLHRLQPTPALIGMLAAVAAINLALVFVAWSSIRSVENTILDLGHEVVDTSRSLRQGALGEVSAQEATDATIFGALPEGYRTLELARQRIDRGEFARARRTLFGLLAIIDRIEPPARGDVEARAQILIADSYRVEAAQAERAPSESSEGAPEEAAHR